jgi:hypothetical protein
VTMQDEGEVEKWVVTPLIRKTSMMLDTSTEIRSRFVLNPELLTVNF